MCKYCIFTMDWTSRISYVHIGQYKYYYYYYYYYMIPSSACNYHLQSFYPHTVSSPKWPILCWVGR